MLLWFIYLSGFTQLEDSGQQLLVTDQTHCVRQVTNMRHSQQVCSGSWIGTTTPVAHLRRHKSPAYVNPNLQKSEPQGGSKPLFSHAKKIKAQLGGINTSPSRRGEMHQFASASINEPRRKKRQITKEKKFLFIRVSWHSAVTENKIYSKVHSSLTGPTEVFLGVSKHDVSTKDICTAPVYPRDSLMLFSAI